MQVSHNACEQIIISQTTFTDNPLRYKSDLVPLIGIGCEYRSSEVTAMPLIDIALTFW